MSADPERPGKVEITFTVNGKAACVHAYPMARLLDVLRQDLELTGAKEGCGEGECGSCSVLMNGDLVNSCLVPVLQARGAEITTIEGLKLDAQLHALQSAFLELGGAQCGICTPGMILAAHYLLARNPSPSKEEIREALSGNLCRCTGYMQIFDSVAEAAPTERLAMRADPADYELMAPSTLHAALAWMASEPGLWTPIAGGTDLMVLYSAGKLTARKLMSIGQLSELQAIEVLPNEIKIGAACTYAILRRHKTIGQEFPLLARAAAWTGSIANQNRGTLGGNIVNASPAADSLPALLVYEAELILASVRGERRVPYRTFHTGYKKMNLEKDELVRAICLPRQFSGYFSHGRKVGGRNAQAISKVCLAAIGSLRAEVVQDARIAIGSVSPTPIRLKETERVVLGMKIDRELLERSRRAAIAEIQPIDDIRSTAAYRLVVAGNLVVEFLQKLDASETLA